MGIAHHQSYHPYRLERVRRDEAAKKLTQTKDADRVLVSQVVAVRPRLYANPVLTTPLQDAESRMDVLRSRAGISSPPHSSPP